MDENLQKLEAVRSIRILLVEDSEGDVFLFRQALHAARLNFELMVLDTGDDGIAFARQQGNFAHAAVPDLAVLDLNLPGSGGQAVLEAMRRNRELESVPVVVFSGSANNRERAAAEALGIERFIKKPHNLEEFLNLGEVLKSILIQNPQLRHLLPLEVFSPPAPVDIK